MRRIDGAEKVLIVATLALPFLIGLIVKGTLTGALLTLVWAGPRTHLLPAPRPLQHQLHLSLLRPPPVCHLGPLDQPGVAFDRDVRRVMAHNHYAFPTSAFRGLRTVEVDLGGAFIRLLERLGLAWDVVRVSPERQGRYARTQRSGCRRRMHAAACPALRL